MSGPPWARLDDLVDGRATAFGSFRRVLVAHRVDEVAGVLDAVEAATAAGEWAVGFVAYEAAAAFDPALRTRDPVAGPPLAWFGLGGPPEAVPVVAPGCPAPSGPWRGEWDAHRHAAGVDRVRAAIAAGEVYQANLTTRLRAPAPADPLALYRDLALGQRGRHNAYLDTGRFVVASASPELFVETTTGTDGDAVRMRPMKGTAARGRTAAEDRARVARLRESPKERAENVMIVDLVRNDLARVAVTGSVTVPRLLHAERYETVHQLTSDVIARARPGTSLAGLFAALFPCGSVTGAPKVSAMALLADAEDSPRGVYCGAVGVVAPPGGAYRARFAVAIRTVVVDRERGVAEYGTGGGITWDSRAADEYAELLAKAAVLTRSPREFELIETMRHDARGLRSVEAHLARLAESASYFGFTFHPAAARALLAGRLEGVGRARVRLRCARDGTLAVDVGALPAPLPRPVRLALDPEPVDTGACWPCHKTTLRAPYTDRLARHPGADDVLLVTGRGEVTESCTANLAVWLDGRWWTPPAAGGLLPGVERARLLAAGVLRERTLSVDDVAGAPRLALVNSLRGWRPAVRMPPAAVG